MTNSSIFYSDFHGLPGGSQKILQQFTFRFPLFVFFLIVLSLFHVLNSALMVLERSAGWNTGWNRFTASLTANTITAGQAGIA